MFRVAALIWMLEIAWWFCTNLDVFFCSMFFTNWTCLQNIAFFLVLIVIQYVPERRSDFRMNLEALHHILYTTCTLSNIVVFSIYWVFLYRMDRQRPEVQASFQRWFHANVCVHLVPQAAFYVNMRMTEVKLRQKDTRVIMGLAVCYLAYYIFVYVVNGGRTLYFFLDYYNRPYLSISMVFFLPFGAIKLHTSLVKYTCAQLSKPIKNL